MEPDNQRQEKIENKPPELKKYSGTIAISKILIAIIGVGLVIGILLLKNRNETQNKNNLNTYTNSPKISPETKSNNNWETYFNKKYKYSIKYPKQWTVEEGVSVTGIPLGPTSAGLILDEDELQEVTFIEDQYKVWQGDFQIRVLRNTKELDLEEWIKNYHVPLTANPKINLAKLVGETMLGNKPAKKISIFGFDHESLAVVAINNGFIYYIKFTGENPNDPEKEKHDEIYARILSSFSFTD